MPSNRNGQVSHARARKLNLGGQVNLERAVAGEVPGC